MEMKMNKGFHCPLSSKLMSLEANVPHSVKEDTGYYNKAQIQNIQIKYFMAQKVLAYLFPD